MNHPPPKLSRRIARKKGQYTWRIVDAWDVVYFQSRRPYRTQLEARIESQHALQQLTIAQP